MMEPKIRFKGFEGEWNDTIWGNHIVSTHTGTNLLGEVSNKGIPLLKMGNIQRGFFDLDKMEYLAANQNPPVNCIANYGDFFYNTRNTLELVGKGATWMKKDGIYAFNSNIAICKLDGIDTFFFNYLYNTLRSIKQVQARAKGTTSVAAVYMRDLKSIELALPHIPEQQAIASYFTSLDSQISASTSRLASLKQMKAASLQAMFPQEGKTVPKIRFKGFEGEWKKVKADSIFKTFNEKNRPDLPVLSATQDRGMVTRESIGYNIFHDTSNEATYKHILPGQFVIHLRSFQGGFAHSEIEGIASPAYTIMDFKNKDLYHDYYWRYVFMSKEFIKRLELITYGIRDGRSISYDEFKEMSFLVPSKEEQIKIASYLRNLDRQISFQSQRLEKLKQIKSACLDKMFV